MRQEQFVRDIEKKTVSNLTGAELRELLGEKPHQAAIEELEESQASNNPAPFPEAAWSGLFGQWRDIVAPCTEAALENLWAAFLVAVGLTMGRSVWLVSPQNIYANVYVLLVGLTGDARKSTALWLARELLRLIGEDIEILSGIVSTEGIFERLAKKENTKALGYADEFRSLLSVAKRKGTQDILPKLNSLYSCPDREGIDRREKSTVVTRPFFSLMAATAKEYIEDLLGNLEIVGGTLNRFLIISGEEQAPKAIVRPPSGEAWESIAVPLRRIRDRCLAGQCRREFSPEAAELWTKFYIEWRNVRKSWSLKEQNLTARVFEHILKIALVYSVLAEEEAISAKSLITAMAIGRWLQKNTLATFGDVGLDQFSKGEKAVLEILRPKRLMYRRQLQQAVSKRGVNGELFGRILKALEANGHLKQGEDTSLAGRIRFTVEYLAEQVTGK